MEANHERALVARAYGELAVNYMDEAHDKGGCGLEVCVTREACVDKCFDYVLELVDLDLLPIEGFYRTYWLAVLEQPLEEELRSDIVAVIKTLWTQDPEKYS